MKIINSDEMLRKKGMYQAKYGIPIDDWSVTVYNEIEEQFEELKSELSIANKELREAKSVIKGKITTVHFNNPKEAIYFGLGLSGPLAIVILILSFLFIFFKNQFFNMDQSNVNIDKKTNAFSTLIQESEVLKEKGKLYLILKPNENIKNFRIGKEYIFEQQKNRVLVPLGSIRPN